MSPKKRAVAEDMTEAVPGEDAGAPLVAVASVKNEDGALVAAEEDGAAEDASGTPQVKRRKLPGKVSPMTVSESAEKKVFRGQRKAALPACAPRRTFLQLCRP